jgi:hypothetical protein
MDGTAGQTERKEFGTKWGRTGTLVVRCLLTLLAAYIVFRKLSPGDLADRPIGQLSVNELFSIIFWLVAALGAGGFLFYKAFNPPEKFMRDQQWYEGWQGGGILMAVLLGWFIYTLNYPPTKEPWVGWFDGVITAVAWLLF